MSKVFRRHLMIINWYDLDSPYFTTVNCGFCGNVKYRGYLNRKWALILGWNQKRFNISSIQISFILKPKIIALCSHSVLCGPPISFRHIWLKLNNLTYIIADWSRKTPLSVHIRIGKLFDQGPQKDYEIIINYVNKP